MSNPISHLSGRAVITITGPDTHDFLQRVITTDMKLCVPGTIHAGALLTPQGKIICDFLIHGTETGVHLDVFAEAADSLVKRLTLYRLRANANISLSDTLIAVAGAGATDPRSSHLPPRSIIEAKSDTDGSQAQAELEIRNGVPSFGRDYGEAEVFPTDVNLDLYGGIGWKKGCFIGQEVLSRMKRRGTIRKRTIALSADAPDLSKGQNVMAGETPLGTITSIAGLNALAMIRMDRLETAKVSPTVIGAIVQIIPPPIGTD